LRDIKLNLSAGLVLKEDALKALTNILRGPMDFQIICYKV
jgi:hypothetical protein